MRIDAHQHFWRLERREYGWLTPDLGAIYRDFEPGDLVGHLDAAGIGRTILVQAAPSEAETRWLLEIAARTPFVAGVVGWVDFDSPDVAARVETAARAERLVGLRPMIQDLPEDAWMLGTQASAAARAMTAANLRFDALVKPRHLPHLRRFLDRHPDLPVVIDHGAKPDIASGSLRDWAAQVRAIASESNASCKLSGLVTEAGAACEAADVAPYVEVLLEAFGARRLMWGSDWPVLNLRGDYAGWAAMCERATSHLDATEKAAIWGGTAARFYGIAT